MVPFPRAGSFSPNPAQPHFGANHSPHPSYGSGAAFSVYLLLSTLKDNQDKAKWEQQVDQLRKLIDEYGMEVFPKYFTRLVASNASQIFPTHNRSTTNQGNYRVLVEEMQKISKVPDQASKIAESIESGTEDIFRDFDLSTFMEHFKLDALDKTILALAFKLCSRSDLKTKADAILSTNFNNFLEILSRPAQQSHTEMSPGFIALVVDRFLQYHPPNFNASSRRDLTGAALNRYVAADTTPPPEVVAAFEMGRVLLDRPSTALARYIQKVGPEFTRTSQTVVDHLQSKPSNVTLSPEQVSLALTFTSISQAREYDPSGLVAGLQRVLPPDFSWTDVVVSFDQPGARISSPQFLRLYEALRPIAQDPTKHFDIQRLWGGAWNDPEAQLSFVCAFTYLKPSELDATTIPGLVSSIKLEDYASSSSSVQQRAAFAVKHPLVSTAALASIFDVALNSHGASQSVEAKRLFQDVVVPNLDIFLVSALDVPRDNWGPMAVDTVNTIFDTFLNKGHEHDDFVMDSLWRKNKDWVKTRLIDTHAHKPLELPATLEQAVRHGWLDDLVYEMNGFGMDLASLAHAEGYLDLAQWQQANAERSDVVAQLILRFLLIKAQLESSYQRPPDGQPAVKTTTTLQLRTVSQLLQIVGDYMPTINPIPDLIAVQRSCITAYPRLINYGEGFDDIIDGNGRNGNALNSVANAKMEEHYKKMYGDELQVREIVGILDQYKHSRDPLDQDVFACMIHGLFDEYAHFSGYPLEALATTAVLFGGIISHRLISELPLQIGLGMILEAVRDHAPDQPMYKFGLQALMQLLVRFREWPGFCKQLVQIPGLRGTEAFKKAEETLREHEEELRRGHNGTNTPPGLGFGEDGFTNGHGEDSGLSDGQPPPFRALHVDPIPSDAGFEDPSEDAQDRIQFSLNNLTESTLQSMSDELRQTMEHGHQQWFASHLVEERAKMQPNYHHVYLELINLLHTPGLLREVLRETYVSVTRMLNSEGTMQNSTERTHLKNLGGWLGLLTLARDKPIKHRNIAFKQLLIEAHDTKRLIVVIPFVCKVLSQGALSAVFRPPNPWLMDIIYLLIDLYHNAELKLNLKFEIEVLCKGLNLDHKSIEPSGEILNRPAMEESAGVLSADQLDTFESLSLNGLGPAVASGLQSQANAPTLPELGPLITIPPANEMVVSTGRLHEIVLTALTRALQDIIQPVVDRSVTIAAISTMQMIRKDFVTEPDEARVRTSAVNMVKATAGSLALVTSKEPLRANFTNYVRGLANDLPSGLPEGTIIMCVNSNIELACSIIEKQAEERAIPEIEQMMAPELENRRIHRATRPNEPYYDSNASRWSMTIPNPYKLSPNMDGLNPEQMAIYEDFGRQPRSTTASSGQAHAPSTSDATRSLANEVLQEQYTPLPNLPTPAETPSAQHLGNPIQPYPPVHSNVAGNIANGRTPTYHLEMRALGERINKLLQELQRVAGEAREEHFVGLPRPHPVLDVVDALMQLIIKAQASEEFVMYAVEQISTHIFQSEDSLTLESLVHVLEHVMKISGGAVNSRVHIIFSQQPGQSYLSLPLLNALIHTDLLDWKVIDLALSRALESRKETALEFLDSVLDLALLNNRPIAMFADFVRTLEEAWACISEFPTSPMAQQLREKLTAPAPQILEGENQDAFRLDQMEYCFEEWVHLCNNFNVPEKATTLFLHQLQSKQVVRNRDDFYVFVRVAMDMSFDRFERCIRAGNVADSYVTIDALATLISIFISCQADDEGARPKLLDSVLALVSLIVNFQQSKRGEAITQKVSFRLLSMLLHQVLNISSDYSDEERQQMVLKFARRFSGLGPLHIPGFVFGWLELLKHRAFLPHVLSLPNNEGWKPFADLVCQLLECVGEHLKAITVSDIGKELYRAAWKLLVVVQHDYPDFVCAHQIRFCASVPPHCTQLINTILAAHPQQAGQPDDAVGTVGDESTGILHDSGLLNIVDQAIRNGPSEDVVAQIGHTMSQDGGRNTGFGHAAMSVNALVVGAVVVHLGNSVTERARQVGGPVAVAGNEPEVATLSMLIHELSPVVRYYLLASIINQLRAHTPQTEFYSQALLHIFGRDMEDPEEMAIRQDITRILLERLGGFWPHPWGLMATIVELLKNEKYSFFDLPFIKADPESTCLVGFHDGEPHTQ
ncbi:General negative regulator of transcription subunit-like protein [Emericellopsis cladophorae]|uniref:General negative regulator of transcription subunit 1 n=1 Tax=Emericellopsis cladophorae TaxID=2686198 RepID=A0A9P9Y5M9_9HYPO|nr:General negative regulator of transcription subunit-like protein [Emericellopsis cladophorae]KAI6783480.1 General negative regulator of transcription subunit-like protein [Emericellopsis cladophorae]